MLLIQTQIRKKNKNIQNLNNLFHFLFINPLKFSFKILLTRTSSGKHKTGGQLKHQLKDVKIHNGDDHK